MSAAPERLDRFMARANARYYATRDPFADFTTAPEIGQVFGELLGAWAATVWTALGAPDPVLLVELGPGRGTLLADALRLAGRVAPAFAGAVRLHLVEASPRLAPALRDRFPAATLHGTLDTVPPGPAIVLANEFLDVLPIRQHVRDREGWRERHVLDGRFVTLPAAAPPTGGGPDATIDAGDDAGGDAVIENCPEAEEIMRALARRGAVALFLDYGGERSTGDTLQALRNRAPADPLLEPGSADLTAHVGFDRLAVVARGAGAAVHGPLSQGLFLTRLGLYPRTRALASRHPDRAATLLESANRLAQPERMGILFKAMALAPPRLAVLPGFEPAPA